MFLELTYVVATPPTDTMAPSNHVVSLPSKRPAQGYVIVVTGGAMSAEAVSQACVATVAYELQRQFHLPHHEPKKFPRSLLTSQKNSLVSFDYHSAMLSSARRLTHHRLHHFLDIVEVVLLHFH
jgi:hypothetical protein